MRSLRWKKGPSPSSLRSMDASPERFSPAAAMCLPRLVIPSKSSKWAAFSGLRFSTKHSAAPTFASQMERPMSCSLSFANEVSRHKRIRLSCPSGSLRSPASMRTTLFVFSSTSCRLIRGRPSSPGWTAYPPALSTSSWTDAAMSNFSSDKRSRTLPERFMTLGCPTGSRIPWIIRWPRRLRLVATGLKLDEHEEGEFRVGHWRTEKPVAVAGFNLGEYVTFSVASPGHSIEVYANRELEENLKNRLLASQGGIPIPSNTVGAPSTRLALAFPPSPPSPADALKQLAKEIDSSVRVYETFSGPFPFHNLRVSQIPGTFGQGWPGLLYISTLSFLSPEAQMRAGLTPTGQEHFTDLVPYHEVAHQWWGNVVGWSSYRDQWIDEAISNYLALLLADTRGNPEHTLRVWLSRYRRQLTDKSPDADEPAAEIGPLTLGVRLNSSKSPTGYERLVYSKGSWVIHMLREMLREHGGKQPDERFIALLQKMVTKYAYRALSTNDFQHEVESVMTPAM